MGKRLINYIEIGLIGLIASLGLGGCATQVRRGAQPVYLESKVNTPVNLNLMDLKSAEILKKEKDIIEDIENTPVTPGIMECFWKAQAICYDASEPERGIDRWRTPLETEKEGLGDCDCKTFYLQDLLEKKGLNLELAYGKLNLTDESMHLWGEFKENGKMFIIDPTTGDYFLAKKRPKDCWVPYQVPESIKAKFENYKIRTGKKYLELNKNHKPKNEN